MKKLILTSAIAISSFIYNTASAQIGFRLNINLGQRPVYVEPAPTPVVADVDFYYLPDVAAYYSVRQQCYYYNDGFNWVATAYLPGAYHDFDWQHARHFAINEDRPYLHDDVYRARFNGSFEGRQNWARRDDDNRGYYSRPANQTQYQAQIYNQRPQNNQQYNGRAYAQQQRNDNYKRDGYNNQRGADERGNRRGDQNQYRRF